MSGLRGSKDGVLVVFCLCEKQSRWLRFLPLYTGNNTNIILFQISTHYFNEAHEASSHFVLVMEMCASIGPLSQKAILPSRLET